jgi:hypothetical protein
MQLSLVYRPLACAVALSLFFALPDRAFAEPLHRAGVGDSYGEPRVVLCSPHHVMTGLREVVGYWLYMIRPVCRPVDVHGNLSDTEALASAELSNEGGLGAHGIWDFLVLTPTCPSGATVAAFDGSMIPVTDQQIEGAGAFLMPGYIRPYCRLAGSEELRRSTDTVGWRPPGNQEMPWASFQAPQSFALQAPAGACEPGTVAVGVWGHADQWLRSFGLVCQSVEEVRPRTIAERGADRVPSRRVGVASADLASAGPAARTAVNGSLQPCSRYEVEAGVGVTPDAQIRLRNGACEPIADLRSAVGAPADGGDTTQPSDICTQRPEACRVQRGAARRPRSNEPAN